jgi:hypothetical protein
MDAVATEKYSFVGTQSIASATAKQAQSEFSDGF